jgi:hypothetical protein
MLHLPYYGVPANLPQAFESFFTDHMKALAAQFAPLLEKQGATAVIETYKNEEHFNPALAFLALNAQAHILIPIIYAVKKEDLTRIHFEWGIPNDDVAINCSNAYFVIFYNELYFFDALKGQYRLTKRGVILRALATLSYTPWKDFLLPVSDQMNSDFLGLPFVDSGKAVMRGE